MLSNDLLTYSESCQYLQTGRDRQCLSTTYLLVPSNDLLTRSHVSTFERGVNVSAFRRLTYSESRQYLLRWRECQAPQTICLLGVTSVLEGVASTSEPSNDLSYLESRQYLQTGHDRQYLQTTYLLEGTSGPSNDLLTRRHVSEGPVNVSALKRFTYSESCQYL